MLSEVEKTVKGGGFAYTRAVCVGRKLGGLQVLTQYPFIRNLDLSKNCIQEPRA